MTTIFDLPIELTMYVLIELRPLDLIRMSQVYTPAASHRLLVVLTTTPGLQGLLQHPSRSFSMGGRSTAYIPGQFTVRTIFRTP
jgi:hypothetical protein